MLFLLLWLLIPVKDWMEQPPVLIGSSLPNRTRVEKPRLSTPIPRLSIIWKKYHNYFGLKRSRWLSCSSSPSSSFSSSLPLFQLSLNVRSVIPSLYMATIYLTNKSDIINMDILIVLTEKTSSMKQQLVRHTTAHSCKCHLQLTVPVSCWIVWNI